MPRIGVRGHFSYRQIAWDVKCAMESLEPELGRLIEATPPWVEDPLKRGGSFHVERVLQTKAATGTCSSVSSCKHATSWLNRAFQNAPFRPFQAPCFSTGAGERYS